MYSAHACAYVINCNNNVLSTSNNIHHFILDIDVGCYKIPHLKLNVACVFISLNTSLVTTGMLWVLWKMENSQERLNSVPSDCLARLASITLAAASSADCYCYCMLQFFLVQPFQSCEFWCRRVCGCC
jgi:uncharacterized protein (UPF0212 family)